MSRYWPHAPYAEEQAYSRAILWTHVLTRAVQTGSVVGAGVGSSAYMLRSFNVLRGKSPPFTFGASLLRSMGVGTAIATGLLMMGIPIRMHDQEDIQWKDRSWRLLENQGQLETDDWTYPSMALGGIGATTLTRGLGWRGFFGGIGGGSIVGMMGYMGWRYGINGGRRREDKAL